MPGDGSKFQVPGSRFQVKVIGYGVGRTWNLERGVLGRVGWNLELEWC